VWEKYLLWQLLHHPAGVAGMLQGKGGHYLKSHLMFTKAGNPIKENQI